MRLERSVTTVLLIYTALLAGCADAPAPGRTGNYPVLEVGLSDIELETAYPANIAGRQDIDIYPKINGFIERVCVREGEAVRKGQILFIIEQVQHKAALQTAEANVGAAKAAVATARLVYDSKKELFANDVVSRFDLSTAENQLLTAEAQLAQAEAQEVDARNNLSYTLVTSPANGIVGTIPYREGTLVSASMPRPLTTVSDNSQVYVYFSMPESQLLGLLRRWGSTAAALQDMPDITLSLNDGS
ncbi:MAG: efflux RND transporter periplasmic adaptor subunit, partial [Alistipes sp.]|nr:efflux RND transporter periplasmic adaptor subunit [Alistipes sp.]